MIRILFLKRSPHYIGEMAQKELLKKLFGEALHNARVSRHMSAYRLAKLIGHQQSRIALLERGESDLRLSSICGLLEVLNMTPGELLDDMWSRYLQHKDTE